MHQRDGHARRRARYEIEVELASRLRGTATSSERRGRYSDVYSEYHDRIVRPSGMSRLIDPPDPARRADEVDPQVRLLRSFTNRKTAFLEVGAGDGAVAKALSTCVSTSLALDVTDATASATTANFDFRTFDGFNFPLPNGSIDLAYSKDVVEHLHPEDLHDHLASLRNVLAPGALYICVTPNRLSGPHDISRGFSETPQGLHLREYTVQELASVLMAAGFTKVKMFASFRGRHLTPLMSTSWVRPFETFIGALPVTSRQRLGHVLAAIKVVGVN
jgi:SAM-dependent methyltransferase